MTSKKYILDAALEILRKNPGKMFFARDLAPIVSLMVNRPVSTVCVAMHLGLVREKLNVVGIRKPGYFLNKYGWKN